VDGLVRQFEALLVGTDPHQAGAFSMAGLALARRIDDGDLGILALAGVDEALLDLRAKLLDLNVARLLGSCRTHLPVYQSSELWVTHDRDALARSAADQVARGFRALKLRLVGTLDDVERVRAVREAIGSDIVLMADFNRKTDRDSAIRIGRELEAFDLAWLEEPCPLGDHEGEAAVAAALETPIASGESVLTSQGVLPMLRLKSCDVLMPDLQRMGGPTQFLKAAAFAEAYGVPVSSHLFHEMSLALLAAIPNATWLEHMPWASPLYARRLELDAQGCVAVPDAPGWGYAFDPKAVARLAAKA
jgi:L-alanine-DL-glutamate epimerase-like enolase superfamily enzyme